VLFTFYVLFTLYILRLFHVPQDFSLKDYNELMDVWQTKVERAKGGIQAWGMFLATTD
jgi:hypothetical protein